MKRTHHPAHRRELAAVLARLGSKAAATGDLPQHCDRAIRLHVWSNPPDGSALPIDQPCRCGLFTYGFFASGIREYH